MKKAIKVISTLLFLPLIIFLLWHRFINVSTEYASAYNETNFNKISLGMTCEDVILLIGQPLEKTEMNKLFWYYAKQGANKRANYHLRNVVFSNNCRVIEIVQEFSYD